MVAMIQPGCAQRAEENGIAAWSSTKWSTSATSTTIVAQRLGLRLLTRLNLIPFGRTAKNVSTISHNNKEKDTHDPSLVKENTSAVKRSNGQQNQPISADCGFPRMLPCIRLLIARLRQQPRLASPLRLHARKVPSSLLARLLNLLKAPL